MVAKIISGKSIRGLLLYNENKVSEGNAHLILASCFGMEVEKLDFNAKLARYERLTSLKPNVKTNALHIMLNFDRMDNPSIAVLQKIAVGYMERIGFGDQPYLVYKHQDVSHPHIHIVTTNINAGAERIDIHGIGWKLSEIARKHLEEEFGLIKADGRKKSEALAVSPIDIEKAIYGKMPTKRAINNIVSSVMRTYKFTSLAEYNAILKQYNVTADRGKEDTIMFERRGLVYSIIDKNGRRIGIPFKASDLTGRPTLCKVEGKFKRSRETHKIYKGNIIERLERVMNSYDTVTLETFRKELEKQKIALILRTNEQGFTYGLTYVDHKSRCVFNGSDLGKAYSAKMMMERFADTDKPRRYLAEKPKTSYLKKDEREKIDLNSPKPTHHLDTLLSMGEYEQAPNMGKTKKRKKRKLKQVETQQGFN